MIHTTEAKKQNHSLKVIGATIFCRVKQTAENNVWIG